MKFKVGNKVEAWEKRHDAVRWVRAEIVGIVGGAYSVKFEDRFGAYQRDEDQVRARPAAFEFKSGDRVLTVHGLSATFLNYNTDRMHARIKLDCDGSTTWHTVSGLTHAPADKPDLRDAVVEAAIEMDKIWNTKLSPPADERIKKLRSAVRAYQVAVEPQRCEPPAEHTDERYHWLSFPNADDVMARWKNGSWHFPGNADDISPEYLATSGYVWKCAAKPIADQSAAIVRLTADLAKADEYLLALGGASGVNLEYIRSGPVMSTITMKGDAPAMVAAWNVLMLLRGVKPGGERPPLQPATCVVEPLPPQPDCALTKWAA